MCLFLVGIYILVKCFRIRRQPTLVKHLSLCSTLTANVILDCKSQRGQAFISYEENKEHTHEKHLSRAPL